MVCKRGLSLLLRTMHLVGFGILQGGHLGALDADLPRSTKTLLEEFGHEAIDVRDIGLKSAKDRVI
ncbi:MAG: hypothetical protein F9K13_12120 [Candidatus Methylomirabilis oxygeniifera]|nr:MAG: hypothetical protein F9K13_12120 [Candidatus Methylomirabilis oxyfera]